MSRAFLEAAGWAEAKAHPMAADASTRQYLRLTRGDETAVLMQAAVETDADRASLSAFRRMTVHLRGLGLSAPAEYAADPVGGLILMEDLGDLTLSRLLEGDPDLACTAYQATAKLLPVLAAPAPDGLPEPGAEGLARMAALTLTLLGDADPDSAPLVAALADAIARHAPGPSRLSLRDVHGDNLIWLPERVGPASIGLLDYQDALLLPEGYDLASLLEDPRREVPEEWREHLIAEHSTPERINILSLARNIRILGIFHRLATQSGKPRYRAFIPRTRALVTRAVDGFPALHAPVAELLDRTAGWAHGDAE